MVHVHVFFRSFSCGVCYGTPDRAPGLDTGPCLSFHAEQRVSANPRLLIRPPPLHSLFVLLLYGACSRPVKKKKKKHWWQTAGSASPGSAPLLLIRAPQIRSEEGALSPSPRDAAWMVPRKGRLQVAEMGRGLNPPF